MYLHIGIKFDFNQKCIKASMTIELGGDFIDIVGACGLKGLYVRNINGIQLVSAKLVSKSQDLVINSDDSSDDSDDDDLYSKADQLFDQIVENLYHIDINHIDCMGCKICGCGCDPMHDGDTGYCDPYPANVKCLGDL